MLQTCRCLLLVQKELTATDQVGCYFTLGAILSKLKRASILAYFGLVLCVTVFCGCLYSRYCSGTSRSSIRFFFFKSKLCPFTKLTRLTSIPEVSLKANCPFARFKKPFTHKTFFLNSFTCLRNLFYCLYLLIIYCMNQLVVTNNNL